jgi:hypothetical protein
MPAGPQFDRFLPLLGAGVGHRPTARYSKGLFYSVQELAISTDCKVQYRLVLLGAGVGHRPTARYSRLFLLGAGVGHRPTAR